MKEIYKLVKILRSISDKSNIVYKNNKVQSLENIYIQGVINQKFTTDKEAAFLLYKTDQSDVRYKMLKHRIKKKLYFQLLTVDLNNSQLVLQKEQECLKLINIAKLLLKKSQYELVINLCKKVRTIAILYEFNDIVLSALEIQTMCLADNGTLKEFLKFKNKQLKYQKIVDLEREAVSLFQRAKVHIKSTVKHRKEHLAELPGVIERLRSIWETIKTYESYNALFKTSMLHYELIGDFDKIVQLAEETESYLKSNIINSERFDKKYNAYILVYAHLRIKSFEKGLKYAEEFSVYFSETTPNWFSYMENYFLLALHAKYYELASIQLTKVLDNVQFKEINSDARERWQLFQAYLHFFKPAVSSNASFNYQKFILSFTEYSKDKQGFNVAILILQFMHFLKKNDSEALLYRIESLKKYSSTHLRDANSLRSNLFLKLLMITVTEDFDVEAIRTKGLKHFHKLIETPPPGDAYAEIEIIPYEHLWEMVLDILEKRN